MPGKNLAISSRQTGKDQDVLVLVTGSFDPYSIQALFPSRGASQVKQLGPRMILIGEGESFAQAVERMRAGGAGIAGFYTATGVGTMVAEGGLPIRYRPDGVVAYSSAPKEVRLMDSLGVSQEFVLEKSIVTDFAIVRASVGDRMGNRHPGRCGGPQPVDRVRRVALGRMAGSAPPAAFLLADGRRNPRSGDRRW